MENKVRSLNISSTIVFILSYITLILKGTYKDSDPAISLIQLLLPALVITFIFYIIIKLILKRDPLFNKYLHEQYIKNAIKFFEKNKAVDGAYYLSPINTENIQFKLFKDHIILLPQNLTIPFQQLDEISILMRQTVRKPHYEITIAIKGKSYIFELSNLLLNIETTLNFGYFLESLGFVKNTKGNLAKEKSTYLFKS